MDSISLSTMFGSTIYDSRTDCFISNIEILEIVSEIFLRWMPQDLSCDQLTLVQVKVLMP